MRKRIRLTGRRQLPRNSVDARILEESGRRAVALELAAKAEFAAFPATARLKLRLSENKMAETLEFGAVGAPVPSVPLNNIAFQAPSCQLRVIASEGERKGLLLGSTDHWTLRARDKDRDGNATEGILLFLPLNIAPLVWKLDVRDEDYPVVYVDRTIPDSRTWVRNDPVFISCVFPVILKDIFNQVLANQENSDRPWIRDWLNWADSLMPGKTPPSGDEEAEKTEWIDALVESFCASHHTLDRLLGRLKEQVLA